MKAPDFSYRRPETLEEALGILNDPEADALPLAGGQSLIPMMNFRVAGPETLVDLNGIEKLQGISVENGEIRIGAMTRYADLARSREIAEHVPLIGLALPNIAHAAIRNRGTIGGSIALADPAAEMPAVALALGASIHVEGPDGARTVAADDFFLGMYETDLDEGELVTAVSIPLQAAGDRFAFYELARRHGDYAMVGVAVATAGSPRIEACRIVFFGVSDRAVRATGAEQALRGTFSGEGIPTAIAALSDLPCEGDLNAAAETKRYLASVVLRRALEGFGE